MGLTYAHGISSSIRDAGHRLTSLVSASVIHASGSTLFNLQVSMSEAAIAQFCAPTSCPAKSAFLRVRTIGLIERSTVDAPIIKEATEPFPVIEAIADRLGKLRT